MFSSNLNFIIANLIYLILFIVIIYILYLQLPTNASLDDDIYLGTDKDSNHYFISDEEFNQHSLVLGTTGSGKTTTLLNIVASCAKRGLPLIYIDGKGSLSLYTKLKSICNTYNRPLKVFSLNASDKIVETSYYNPLFSGNYTQWKNKIVTLLQDSSSKGQEHYTLQEEAYISLVCEIIYKSGNYIDLEGFLGYLAHPLELQKLANKVDANLALRLNQTSLKIDTADIYQILQSLYYSAYGHLFSTSNKPKEQQINLEECLSNGDVVLFLLDAASYKRDTKLLGRLLINDINHAFNSLANLDKKVKAYCVFDEFASYSSPNMASILSLQRENGLHGIIGTQSIQAIAKESKEIERVAVELIANCNTYIIHKLNDYKDIELLIKTVETLSPELGGIEVSDIQSLSTGYAYICRRVIGQNPVKVKIHFEKGSYA